MTGASRRRGAASLAGLSLRDLEYVVAVAEHRHFGRAAEACAVSQPALSAQIRKTEELLGVVLFERGRRGVTITGQGRALVAQARRILAEGHRLFTLARSQQGGLAGPLALAAIETLGPYLFPHILRPLRERYGALDLSLHEGRTARLLELLAEGELDLVLLSLPVHRTGLTAAPLFFEPFLFLHAPDEPLARRRPLALADLASERFLLLEEGHCLRGQALALCGLSHGTGRRHAASLETLRHMVAVGAGYSVIPALAASPDPRLEGLVRCTPFDDPTAGREIALLWRSSDPREPEFTAFADFLRDIAPPGTRRLDRRHPDATPGVADQVGDTGGG